MQNLIIYPTQDTPGIHFDPIGKLSIKGISIPENVNLFYQQIFDWMDGFKAHLPERTQMNLSLEYMNTSSIKIMVQLLKNLIDECEKQQKQLVIRWICDEDDDELIEEGELLQECVNFNFEFASTED